MMHKILATGCASTPDEIPDIPIYSQKANRASRSSWDNGFRLAGPAKQLARPAKDFPADHSVGTFPPNA